MTAAVVTQGLGRRYGRRWALANCTIELPAGRVAGLVGPNGAGKTTLLHLLAGLLRPSAGSVTVLGCRPGSRQALPRLGFVAQDKPLYRGFTVEQTLAMGGWLNPGFDHDLAGRRLAQSGIPRRQPVGRLSSGQQAQVALALALGKRPELLVLDEPVNGLDPLARREFLAALMEEVAESGCTVLLSSHLIADLPSPCSPPPPGGPSARSARNAAPCPWRQGDRPSQHAWTGRNQATPLLLGATAIGPAAALLPTSGTATGGSSTAPATGRCTSTWAGSTDG